MSRAGVGLCLPPSLSTAIQRRKGGLKKGDEEREKEHPRKCRCTSSTGKWPQRGCEGESESGAFMATQRSGYTCRAMQAVFFMHKREGGRWRHLDRSARDAYPPHSLLSNYVWCSASLPVCLCATLCHNRSVWRFSNHLPFNMTVFLHCLQIQHTQSS